VKYRFVVIFSVYLAVSLSFAAGIDDIICTDKQLQISYQSESRSYLIELEPYQEYRRNGKYHVLDRYNPAGSSSIDRFLDGRDRLYSKFALIDSETDSMIGDYRYVTSITDPINGDFKLPRPESIKGLSCIIDIDDAVELGVKYVHENMYINEFVDFTSSDPEAYYEFDGLKIPLNMARVRGLDSRMKKFTENGIAVFIVFINQMPKDPDKRTPLIHPDSDVANSPTHLGAFNITDSTGLKYYLGILEFLAGRYTRADKKYGLISSVIVGNEVQQHWIWHNMGDVREDKFIKEYEQSLRLAWLACSKFNTDLKVYVSMDHHWSKRGFNNNVLREIPGDILLEKIAKLSKAGGDYPWNVAFHPYPENLFEARFWFDKSPTDDFSTPRITFKNLDVLPRFMKQDKMLYKGHIRDIALTEQGFHSPEGIEGEKIQAAAYAYAYYKITQIPEISAFILHRHVDHRDEGGLKLGLWSNKPDGKDSNPWKKKYIWKVFKYADTDNWKRAFAFAKPILGIEEWGQTPANTDPEVKSIFNVSDDAVIYDFVKNFDKSVNSNNLDCSSRNVYRAAGWLVPAIFQHPPDSGKGMLKYSVDIPEVKKGQKISLLFETIVASDKGDGVNYSVMANNTELWSGRHETVAPESYCVDMTEYAGKKVSIRFIVDKNNNSANDWSYWVSPMLVIE
jgi:hypothetical protein